MRDIIEISPHVLPVAPTCPEPTMIHHLRESCIEFCERTRYWRQNYTYKLEQAEKDILLVTTLDSVIHEIESVRWRQTNDTQWSNPLSPAAYEDVRYMEGNQVDGAPNCYTQMIPNTLQVLPFSSGVIQVTMFLKPDQDADTLPDFIFETFPRIIAYGALAEILLLAGNEFTNPQLASVYRLRFDAACDKHFRGNLRGQQRATIRTKPNYF